MRPSLAVQGVLSLLAAGLAAGCQGAGGPPSGPTDGSLPRLADFQTCRWQYLDGSSVPCTNQATPMTVAASPPSTWICVDNTFPTGTPRYQIYRNAVGPGFGIHYHSGARVSPLGGVLWVATDGRTYLGNWTDAGVDAFVSHPGELGQTARLAMLVYNPQYASNATPLAEGDWRQVWSRYNNTFSVIHEAEFEGQRFQFYKLTTDPYLGITDSLGPFRIEGADFDLRARLGKFIAAQGGEMNVYVPQTDCN